MSSWPEVQFEVIMNSPEYLAEDRSTELLVIIWIFTALAALAVAVKIFTRAHILHALWWDDFFIFLSMALAVVCSSLFAYDVKLGMGKHVLAIPPNQVSQAVKINLIANPFGIMAFSLPNISIAILLDRLLIPNTIRSRFLYALAISQCVIAAISCVLLFTQCTPTEFLWNPTIDGKCFAPGVFTGYSYFVGSYTAMTDVILGLVPVIAFWRLTLKWTTKLGIILLMSCTLFAAICAIVKTTKLYQLADLADFTYGTVDLIIWAIVEANVIIIAACVPTLRPFFYRAFKDTKRSEGRSAFSLKSSGLSYLSLFKPWKSQSSRPSILPSNTSQSDTRSFRLEEPGQYNSIPKTANDSMTWNGR